MIRSFKKSGLRIREREEKERGYFRAPDLLKNGSVNNVLQSANLIQSGGERG